MPATKTPKRKTSHKSTLLKEVRAEYMVRKNSKAKPQAKETQIEFHICLPKDSDVEQFTDKLIALVEAYNGETGGGSVNRHK